jgi:hypothetical protein
MNANDMLDYALGQLDGPARARADREIASDPAAAGTVDRLTQAVHLLLDDGQVFEPPPALAARTVRFVAESVHRKRTILDYVPVTVPFRWADVAVAAGILFAGLLTLLPAVQRSRERMEQAGCGYNLQQLGRALWQYGSRHNHYPFSPEQNPNAPVGAYLAMLHDSGDLGDPELDALDCPCNGHARKHHAPLPDFETVCRLHASDPRRAHDTIGSDYAYNVGYRHPELRRVVPIAAVHSATVPLLADQPPQEDFRVVLTIGNSPNHGGRGQNVLYSDLHVGWHNTRRLGPKDDDMFLNARHEPRPGLSFDDAALLPSMLPALGR